VDLSQLLTAAETGCTALRDSDTCRGVLANASRLFEICCACEQILSDLYVEADEDGRRQCHASACAFATLASQIAEHAFVADSAAGLADVAARISEAVSDLRNASTIDLTASSVRPAECFARDLIDPVSYARFAREQVAKLEPTAAIVIGIRTSGCYLAPIWDAALRSAGSQSVLLTARPDRQQCMDADGRSTDPSPDELWVPPAEDDLLLKEALAGRDARAVHAIVIDDLAFTGSSFVRIDNYLAGIGVAGANVIFIEDTPLIVNTLTPAARARFSERRVVTAPKMPDSPEGAGEAAARFFDELLAPVEVNGPDIRVTAAELAPPMFALRHLAARISVPSELIVHFNPRARDRRYLIDATVDGRPTRLLAKILGTGFLAEREVERIRRFEDASYRVVAYRGGFLFYEWIEGEPLGPDDAHLLEDADVDRLATYAAKISRLNFAGHLAGDVYADDVRGRLRRAITPAESGARSLEPAISMFLRAVPGSVPIVNAPRNQGHWHHVRTHDGDLRRVHVDIGEWSWRMDTAEELASAVIELGLSPAQQEQLISRFIAHTGDDGVAARMRLGAVSYAARILESYRYWDGQVEQVPAEYRRPAEHPLVVRERPRRSRMLDAISRVLVIGHEEGDGGA
jgi:hypothetical protein